MAGGSMLRLMQGMSNLSVCLTPWNLAQRCFTRKPDWEIQYEIEKPKRPQPTFILFRNDKKNEILQKYPNASPQEISRIAGKLWNESSDDVKARYSETYKRNIVAYQSELKDYETALLDKQKALMQSGVESDRFTNFKLSRRKKQKKMVHLNKPVKPPNPFLRFFLSLKLAKKIPEGAKEASAQWAQLPDEQKNKYITAYEKEYAKYLKDLDAWEQKMIAEGHLDIIRVKTLKQMAEQSTEK